MGGDDSRRWISVLDFSRLEAATVKPAPAWVALPDLVDQVAAAYQLNAELKGLKLTHECQAVEIHTDANLMERIVRNLVENALKFTDRGAVNISAGFVGDEFVMAVADSGPGVRPPSAACRARSEAPPPSRGLLPDPHHRASDLRFGQAPSHRRLLFLRFACRADFRQIVCVI